MASSNPFDHVLKKPTNKVREEEEEAIDFSCDVLLLHWVEILTPKIPFFVSVFSSEYNSCLDSTTSFCFLTLL